MPKFLFEIGDIITNDELGQGIVIASQYNDHFKFIKYLAYFYNAKFYQYLPTNSLTRISSATDITRQEARDWLLKSVPYVQSTSKWRYHFGDIILPLRQTTEQLLILDNGHVNRTNNRVYYHVYGLKNNQFMYITSKKRVNDIVTPSNPDTQKQARNLLLANIYDSAFD